MADVKVEGELVPGQYYEIVMTGSITDVGKTKNTFEFNIYDQNKNNVTSNYYCTIYAGYLTVTEKEIGISSASHSKQYDGTPLAGTLEDISYTGELVPGHKYEIQMTGSRTTVGYSSNSFTYKIVDENGVDVTSNYDVKTKFG